MRYILIFFLSLVTFSCQLKKASKSKLNIESDSILLIKGVKQLLMDELDYPLSGHIRYYESNGKSYLVQGNESQKIIRVYDYHSGVKSYEEVFEGAKGEFFAYNSDTAFAIANGIKKSTIYMWDKGNTSTLSIPVNVSKGHIEQYPRCRLDGGAFVNGKWYFSCFRLGEYPNEMQAGEERFPILEVDFNKGISRFIGAYPKLYAQNNMGTLNYWVPDMCSENNGNEILVGFKASPEMLLLNPSNRKSRFVSVRSIYADTIPLPLTEKGRDYFSESESYYYFAQYTHYGSICYDKWRNIYYRFVGIGLDDWTLDSDPLLQNRKNWSIMVFDESFNKLGEQYIGDSYVIDQHFVSPDGLYILNKDKNEDIAVYTLFQYIKG